jgi:hypothetical protein
MVIFTAVLNLPLHIGIHPGLTGYSHLKGNADTTRFLRTLEGGAGVAARVGRPGRAIRATGPLADSVLGTRAPNVVEAEQLRHATPLAAACQMGSSTPSATSYAN